MIRGSVWRSFLIALAVLLAVTASAPVLAQEFTQVTTDPAIDWDPAWSPDGSEIAFGHEGEGAPFHVWAVRPDGTGLRRITPDEAPGLTPSWSPDGSRLVYQPAWPARLRVINRDGTGAGEIPGTFGGTIPAWSPDGNRVAFCIFGPSYTADVWIVNTDGTGLTQVTSDPPGESWLDTHPAWSPDGTEIAFTSNRGGYFGVWAIRPDGTGLRRITPIGPPGAWTGEPAWSPDGQWISFESWGDVWAIARDGSALRRITTGGGWDGTWSPDGNFFAFSSGRAGNPDIWMTSLTAPDVFTFADDFEDPAFSNWNWAALTPGISLVTLDGNNVGRVAGADDPTNSGSESLACADSARSYYVDQLRIGTDIRISSVGGGYCGVFWGYEGITSDPRYGVYYLALFPAEDLIGIANDRVGADEAFASVPGLEYDTWYRLELVSTDTNFEVWLAPRGEALVKVLDVPHEAIYSGHHPGEAGAVGAYADNTPFGIAYFDNFVVVGVPEPRQQLACPIVRALREKPARVPVWLNEGNGVAGLQFDLYYDASLLTGLTSPEVIKGSLIADDPNWALAWSLIAPGHLRVIAYNQWSQPLPPGAHGEVAVARFTVNPAAAPRSIGLLDLEGVILSDRHGAAIPCGAWDGAVRIARAAEGFAFDPIPSPQGGDLANPLPFAITIRALDEYGDLATPYDGTANLSDLTATLTPTTAGFTDGLAVPTVTVSQPIASDQISAVDASDAWVHGTSNSFSVIRKADVNADLALNVLDVMKVVNIILGYLVPPPWQFWAADLNSDGEVNVQDIILIINKIFSASGMGGALMAASAQASAEPVVVEAVWRTAASGNQVLAVTPSNASGVAGAQVEVTYNLKRARLVAVRGGTLIAAGSDWNVYGSDLGGAVRALAFSGSARGLAGGKGSIIEIEFAATGKGNLADIAEVILTDGAGNRIPARLGGPGKPGGGGRK
jgi:hypothetical protein